MRIRYKPWARRELEESKFYINEPEKYRGKWRSLFEEDKPLYVELGCGKGRFISNIASENLDINFIGIDMIDAMLGLAKRNIEEIYSEKKIDIKNVYLTRFDIERILLIFDVNDRVDRIYINFCNPWPRGKHRKKRLTHTRQLENYKCFLKDDGEIYFKTDDDLLFNDSLSYFTQSGFEIVKKTYDLEEEANFWNNIETEHEKMFKEQGIKIKALIAKRVSQNDKK